MAWESKSFYLIALIFFIALVPFYVFLITSCWDNSASTITSITAIIKYDDTWRAGYMPDTLCFKAEFYGWICGYGIGERFPTNPLIQWVNAHYYLVVFPSLGLIALVLSYLAWGWARNSDDKLDYSWFNIVAQMFCIALQVVAGLTPFLLVKYTMPDQLEIGGGAYTGIGVSAVAIIIAIFFIVDIRRG